LVSKKIFEKKSYAHYEFIEQIIVIFVAVIASPEIYIEILIILKELIT
jgi:hypothetical protein